MKNVIVSSSILGVNNDNYLLELKRIKDNGIKWVHFDVMDAKFVPALNFENDFFLKVAKEVSLIKDVHIMVNDPIKRLDFYAKQGVDYLTFHYEACKDDTERQAIIDKIHSLNMKAGISIKPNTSVLKIFPFLKDLDLVLVMSVEPGYGGQKFNDSVLFKIKDLKAKITANNYRTLISVDGGINNKTAPLCLSAGADVLVVGQYLFGREDYVERLEQLIK